MFDMGYTVLQLGYGMQGEAVLADLLKNTSVSKVIVMDARDEIADLPKKIGDPRIEAVKADISDLKTVKKTMEKSDVVIELMPGTFALTLAKASVEVGVSHVSTMYLQNPGETDKVKKQKEQDDLYLLDQDAKAKKITVLPEMGMDPRMDLILGKRAVEELDEVKVFHSYGAGFPELSAANNPIRYKFTWSIEGVIRSYLRPARVLKEGVACDIEADEMFAPENMHLLQVPDFSEPLECFANGDSISYASFFGIENSVSSMGRYICRWPGHASFWHRMAKCGFLSDKPIGSLGGVRPAAFCAALLGEQEQFRYGHDERDLAIIRSDVRGFKDGKTVRVVYEIIDRRDTESGLTAMQRTVGFSASIAAGMILDRSFAVSGLVNPTSIPFDVYTEELAKRNIRFRREAGAWNGDEKPDLMSD